MPGYISPAIDGGGIGTSATFWSFGERTWCSPSDGENQSSSPGDFGAVTENGVLVRGFEDDATGDPFPPCCQLGVK